MNRDSQTIAGHAYSDYVIMMEEFHGARSPGMLLGGLMIDVALAGRAPAPFLNMVCETVVCLPDAVQLLTPCTVGNGFLQLLDWGKFAISAYDRTTLKGTRVWLNLEKLPEYPLIHHWFDRSKGSKEKPPFDEIAVEMLNASDTLLKKATILLKKSLKSDSVVPTRHCPGCGESYPTHHGPKCPACSGKSYYRIGYR